MQTFLPEKSFEESAKALDTKRLGKQRVETYQLLKSLAGDSKGWINHPACKMWVGYERLLVDYGLTICKVWKQYGYKDTCYEKIEAYLNRFPVTSDTLPWYTNEFIQSHRSNLIRKDQVFYGPKWPDVSPDLPYIWPV